MKKENTPSASSNSIEEGWIDVTDKLPEQEKEVLICEISWNDKKGNGKQYAYYVSYWDGSYTKYNKRPQFPDGQDEQPSYYTPQYWRPLPAPPNSEQKDKRSVATKSNQGDAARNIKEHFNDIANGRDSSLEDNAAGIN